MSQREIVEAIADKRRRELNSGPSLLGALGVIADQLYAEPTHFILEFLQNADDALDEAEIGNERKVLFRLHGDVLLIANTGKGFDQQDVDALSCVGASRKGPRHIGHKGIGFKSVFAVCDQPQVHSNGYAFRFASGSWIVPEWLDKSAEEAGYRATFILPLKDSAQHGPLIRRQLEQIDSRLLLFLPHLRQIEVNGTILRREDVSDGSCTLTHGDRISRWKTYEHDPDVPDNIGRLLAKQRGLQDYQRPSTTRIAVAVELNADGTSVDSSHQGKLFAFLPTGHDLHIPFDVQADFELNAERTALRDAESGWNRWLLQQVSSVAPKIFDDFRRGSPDQDWFYALMPERSDAGDLWRVWDDFKKGFDEWFDRNNTVRTADGGWCKPSEAVLADATWLKLANTKLPVVETGASLRYSQPGSDGRARAYLKERGVTELGWSHVMSVLKQLGDTLAPLEWHDELLVWLANAGFKLLDSEGVMRLEELRGVPILPATDGRPSASKSQERQLFRLPTGGEVRGFELFADQCCFLHPDLDKRLPQPSDYSNWRRYEARRLLSKLAPDITPQEIHDRFIQPAFEDDQREQTSQARLFQLTKFVKDHRKQIPKALIKLKTLAGTFQDPIELYLSSAYDPEACFETLIEARDHLLSDEYLNLDPDAPLSERQKDWRSFVFDLGVNQFPRLLQGEPISIGYQELRERLGAKPEHTADCNGYRLIEVTLDPTIQSAVSEATSRDATARLRPATTLLGFLDKHWTEVRRLAFAKYQYCHRKDQGWSSAELPDSQFIRWLRQEHWIPAQSGRLCSTRELADGTETLAVSLTCPEFEEFLGAADDPKRLCSELLATSRRSQTDVALYRDLYRRLYRCWRKARTDDECAAIAQALVDQPIVFVPGEQPQWFKPKETVWKAPAWLRRTPLNKVEAYKTGKAWFTEMLGVPFEPTPASLLDFAEAHLWSAQLVGRSKKTWCAVLTELERALDSDQDAFFQSVSLEQLKRRMRLYLEGQRWSSVISPLYYRDDEIAEGVPPQNAQVLMPFGDEPQFPNLYEVLGVQKLSSVSQPLRPSDMQEVRPDQVTLAEPLPLPPVPVPPVLPPEPETHRDRLATVERRQELGRRAEKLVLEREKQRLREAGQNALADQVQWVSEASPGHPFDIASFDQRGSGEWVSIDIEVKGTVGGFENIGPLSARELAHAQQNKERHRLYLVCELDSPSPRFMRLRFEGWETTPDTYRIIVKHK